MVLMNCKTKIYVCEANSGKTAAKIPGFRLIFFTLQRIKIGLLNPIL